MKRVRMWKEDRRVENELFRSRRSMRTLVTLAGVIHQLWTLLTCRISCTVGMLSSSEP